MRCFTNCTLALLVLAVEANEQVFAAKTLVHVEHKFSILTYVETESYSHVVFVCSQSFAATVVCKRRAANLLVVAFVEDFLINNVDEFLFD